MSLLPFESRVPTIRSRFSHFRPSWEVGLWDDFGFSSTPFESRFREMEKDIEQMFGQFPRLLPLDPVAKNWVLESPVVTDQEGVKSMKMDFDVRQFKPDEITVKTKDNQLSVHAKHESKSADSQSYSEYYRMYSLPPGVKGENIKPMLTPDGVLTIEATIPAVEQPRERIIPIERAAAKK